MPTISPTDTTYSLPVIARQLGTTMKLVNRLMKGCPGELEGRARVEWLLCAMGLEEGVGGWDSAGFWKSLEGVASKEVEVRRIEPMKEGGAVEALLVERCPNEMFWRARIGGMMEVVREDRAWMRGRMRVGLRMRARKLRGVWVGC